MSNPKLSVIIPVYNVEQYLQECLDSIINQTFKDIEIICVNDGSTDNSLEILKKYAQKDKRIIIINKQNGGLSSARNIALDIAKGEFISFVDSDDYIDINTYSVALSKFTDDIDLICYNYNFIFEDGAKHFDTNQHGYTEGIHLSDEVITQEVTVAVWSKIFKKSIIDKLNLRFLNGLYFEDTFFTRAYLYSINKIYFLNDYFYNYRQRCNSITGKANNHEKSKDMSIDILKNMDKLILFCIENNVKTKYYPYLSYLFIKLYIDAIHIETNIESINKINKLAYEISSKYSTILTDHNLYKRVIGDLSYRECGISYINGIIKIQKCIRKIRVYIFGCRVLTFKNNIL